MARKDAIGWCIFNGKCKADLHVVTCPRRICICDTSKAVIGPVQLSAANKHKETCPRGVFKYVDETEMAMARFLVRQTPQLLQGNIVHEDWTGIYDKFPKDAEGHVRIPWSFLGAETCYRLEKINRLLIIARFVEVTDTPPLYEQDLVFLRDYFYRTLYLQCSVLGTKQADLVTLIPHQIPISAKDLVTRLTTKGFFRMDSVSGETICYRHPL